jgi:hypothetical protein
MADGSAHLRQATRNRELVTKLRSGAISAEHPDWVVTVAFYTVVHLVEAIFASARLLTFMNGTKQFSVEGPIHSDSPPAVYPGVKGDLGNSPHRIRGTIIRWNPKLISSSCNNAYRTLLEMSFASRYQCHDVPPSDGEVAIAHMEIAWGMLTSRYETLEREKQQSTLAPSA